MRRTKESKNKGLRINGCLITIIAVMIAFGISASAVLSDKNDFGLFGYGLRIVMSSSMEADSESEAGDYRIKNIRADSLIIIELVPNGLEERQKWYAKLRKGDVLTFSYKIVGQSLTITHRIKEIEKDNDNYKITLAGDNVRGEYASTQIIYTDDEGGKNRITGKVIYSSYFLGMMVGILKDPLFDAAIIILFMTTVLSIKYKDERKNGYVFNHGNRLP